MTTAVTFPMQSRAPIAYESAKDHEVDTIHAISFEQAAMKLLDHLSTDTQRRAISSIAALHLGLDPERQHQRCVVQERETWIRGNFNVCIPVRVLDDAGDLVRRVMVRCPMAHKLSEERDPGSIDEKISTEMATYIWMQEHCPDVRIPDLLGFGFTDGRHFTHVRCRPFYIRWARAAWRRLHALLHLPLLSQYVRTPFVNELKTGYVVLEYLEPTVGHMLSASWEGYRRSTRLRQNLFRGLSRLMLRVSRIPQPRIGSWRFHDDGTITLSNRPLTCGLAILENNKVPRVIQPDDTYSCVEPYIWDLLSMHDGRLNRQPNAANDEADCRYQMGTQVILRAVAHHYFDRDRRQSPFVMQFSDLHASNIFVDSRWNVTAIIDLEWISSRPADMIDVPHWITSQGIDQVGKEGNVDEFIKVRDEFLAILEKEDQAMTQPNLLLPSHGGPISAIVRRSVESKLSWFAHCLDSVNAMYTLCGQHLLPQFVPFRMTTNMDCLLSRFWCQSADEFVKKKLRDRGLYDSELRSMFGKEDIAEQGSEEPGQTDSEATRVPHDSDTSEALKAT